MAESIEAFVQKLHEEGVETGRQAGQQILAEAKTQAEAILQEANRQAKQIVDAAQRTAEDIRQRTDTELKLAARDAVGRLQEAIGRAAQALLHNGVEQTLREGDFLAPLIRDVVMRYVEADVTDSSPIAFNIPRETGAQVTEWIMKAFSDTAEVSKQLDLRASLSEAGFEYKIGDGTVEVTTASVVDVLMELVGPDLRKIVAAAQE